MAPSDQSKLQILHAYRHLYRGLLRAVQYSSPNRYVARDQMRDAFRRGHSEQFNKQKISRTLEFLGYAAHERGLEHRLVKNLLHVAYWRTRNLRRRPLEAVNSKYPLPHYLRATARNHYDMTVAMLNDSMGLCLR